MIRHQHLAVRFDVSVLRFLLGQLPDLDLFQIGPDRVGDERLVIERRSLGAKDGEDNGESTGEGAEHEAGHREFSS